MRVVFVHTPSRPQIVTGEDIAAENQATVLRRAGVDVEVRSVAPGRLDNLRATKVMIAGSHAAYLRTINDAGADLVHLHKWFPWLGRNDMMAISAPKVATIHNFRPLCPVGTLFRDGEVCTDCVDDRPFPAVLHGCYRGSSLKTIPVALSRPSPARRHAFLSELNGYVFPSDRAKTIVHPHLDGGAVERVIPSCVPAPNRNDVGPPNESWLYVGQLEETKGIRRTLEIWPRDVPLTIIGSGSQFETLRRVASGKKVCFKGKCSPEDVRAAMATHIGLIFPSSYLETQGLVIGEAASVNCPIIALEGTAGADQVERFGLGAVVRAISEIPLAVTEVGRNRERYRSNSAWYWETELKPEVWASRMIAFYEAVLGSKRAGGGGGRLAVVGDDGA